MHILLIAYTKRKRKNFVAKILYSDKTIKNVSSTHIKKPLCVTKLYYFKTERARLFCQSFQRKR